MGIDPGLATIGIGVLDAESPSVFEALDWCTIETKAGVPGPERLAEIAKDLTGLISQWQPELAVVEKLFFEKNVRTAINVAEARGVILATLGQANIRVLEPTPLQLKSSITGDGRADKTQVQTMLMTLLKLEDPPTPDDAADALALAVLGALLMGRPIMLA